MAALTATIRNGRVTNNLTVKQGSVGQDLTITCEDANDTANDFYASLRRFDDDKQGLVHSSDIPLTINVSKELTFTLDKLSLTDAHTYILTIKEVKSDGSEVLHPTSADLLLNVKPDPDNAPDAYDNVKEEMEEVRSNAVRGQQVGDYHTIDRPTGTTFTDTDGVEQTISDHENIWVYDEGQLVKYDPDGSEGPYPESVDANGYVGLGGSLSTLRRGAYRVKDVAELKALTETKIREDGQLVVVLDDKQGGSFRYDSSLSSFDGGVDIEATSLTGGFRRVWSGKRVETYWWGAEANGITDTTHADYHNDSTAIQSAIDYAAANDVEAILPAATHVIDSIVKLKDGLTLSGVSRGKSVIKSADNQDWFNNGLLKGEDIDNIRLTNFTVDGNRAGGAYKSNAIQLLGVRRGLIASCNLVNIQAQDIDVGGKSGDGVMLGLSGTNQWCEDVTVQDSYINNCVRQGVSVISARNTKLINLHIQDITGTNPGWGVDMEADQANDYDAVYGLLVQGCRIDNANGGIGMNNLNGADMDNLRFLDNYITNTRSNEGIRIKRTTNASVNASGNQIEGGGSHGIRARNSGHVNGGVISDNVVRNNAGVGIFIDQNCRGYRVHDNLVAENGEHGIQTTYVFDEYCYHRIHDNEVFNNGTSSIGTYHGVNVQGNGSHPAMYNSIYENIIGNDPHGDYGTDCTQDGIHIEANAHAVYVGINIFVGLLGDRITNTPGAPNRIIGGQDSDKVTDFHSGMAVGQGAKIAAHLSATTTWDPPSLADGAQQSTTITVTGAAVGDEVAVSFSNALSGTRLWGEVTAADTVTVYHRNDTGGAVDLASGTLRASVWQH